MRQPPFNINCWLVFYIPSQDLIITTRPCVWYHHEDIEKEKPWYRLKEYFEVFDFDSDDLVRQYAYEGYKDFIFCGMNTYSWAYCND